MTSLRRGRLIRIGADQRTATRREDACGAPGLITVSSKRLSSSSPVVTRHEPSIEEGGAHLAAARRLSVAADGRNPAMTALKVTTLEERYVGDPRLLRFYQKKLPQAGWAGATDEVERRFIAATRKAQGRKPRGRPFQPQTPVPSQRRAPLKQDLSKVEDAHVPVAAAR